MRLCPLINRQIPCDPSRPFCGLCESKAQPASTSTSIVTTIQSAVPAVAGKPARSCIDCSSEYTPTSPRQQRCANCAMGHARKKNALYQAEHRRRERERESPESQCRQHGLSDFERSHFEMLAGNGLSGTAIAQKTQHSHHTVLRHLARPEAQRRVAILRRLDLPNEADPHPAPPQHETNYPKEEVIRAYNPPSEPQTPPPQQEVKIRYNPVLPGHHPDWGAPISPLFRGLWFRW